MLEGYNNIIVMYKNQNLDRQKFTYDKKYKTITSDATHNVVATLEGNLG